MPGKLCPVCNSVHVVKLRLSGSNDVSSDGCVFCQCCDELVDGRYMVSVVDGRVASISSVAPGALTAAPSELASVISDPVVVSAVVIAEIEEAIRFRCG